MQFIIANGNEVTMTNKKKLKVATLDCCLCGKQIDEQVTKANKVYWTEGHNAEPLNKGRCCTKCNNEKVIPYRMLCVVDDRLERINSLLKQVIHSAKVDGTDNIHALKYQLKLMQKVERETRNVTQLISGDVDGK